MRLIDADALMRTLGITDMDCDKCKWGDDRYCYCTRGSDFADACLAIEEAPTIEERNKGRWLDDHGNEKKDGYGADCSVCGWWSEYLTDFCGSCGADMRGEE